MCFDECGYRKLIPSEVKELQEELALEVARAIRDHTTPVPVERVPGWGRGAKTIVSNGKDVFLFIPQDYERLKEQGELAHALELS